jgi:hypothetical protein
VSLSSICPFLKGKIDFFSSLNLCIHPWSKGYYITKKIKRTTALVAFIAFAGIIHVLAQATPVGDQRQSNQRHRIQQGVANGELTRRETEEARQNQRKVRRTERRAKTDGTVTANERTKIHHKQNKASRQLRKNKHDGEDRPSAN